MKEEKKSREGRKEGEGVGFFRIQNTNAGHWSFLNIRNRRWECRQLTFLIY